MSLESQSGARLEDDGAALLDHMSGFWERYGKIALGVVLALVAAGAVMFFTMNSRRATEDQAAGRLAEATLHYFQGDLPRARETARQVADQFPNTASGGDAHRLMGDAAFWANDYKTAVAEYRRYLAKAPKGVLSDAATRSLAYALENDAQPAEAAKNYEALIGKFDRESSGEFLSAAARCQRTAGDTAGARRNLERLIAEFGETSYARAARISVAELSVTP
ncbi:MAG: tetratricopeptide repeat protein [Candidatus Eisenbacteria bacterium]